jgi:hypothetical protein
VFVVNTCSLDGNHQLHHMWNTESTLQSLLNDKVSESTPQTECTQVIVLSDRPLNGLCHPIPQICNSQSKCTGNATSRDKKTPSWTV